MRHVNSNNTAETILEHFNIKKYFTVITGSLPNGVRDSKNEVIEHALSELNIKNKSEAVMVGDRDNDISGAKENGIASVGVLYGYGSGKELKEAGADYIVKNVSDLTEFLKGH